MMPDGLVSSLKSRREFLDLLSYLFAIQAGGPLRAEDLKPSPEQLNVKDDTVNLNHAKIIQKVEDRKQKRGRTPAVVAAPSAMHSNHSSPNVTRACPDMRGELP